MRRFLIPALMISLLLTGCGERSAALQRRVTEQRERFAAAETLGFTADVTADLGGEVFQCTLAVSGGADTVTAEVTAPESIAGARTRFENGEAVLEYGEVSLGVGPSGTEGLSPVRAAALLHSALRSGFLQRCWTEREESRELVAAELYVTDDADLTLWFEKETMTPVHCEFSQAGSTVVRCEIRDFAIR